MKSLLFQDSTPFVEAAACAAVPCRTEVEIKLRKDGRLYLFKLRDKIVPEDPYLVMVKAAGFALSENEPYNGGFPDRSVKDFLIKDVVVI